MVNGIVTGLHCAEVGGVRVGLYGLMVVDVVVDSPDSEAVDIGVGFSKPDILVVESRV